MSFGSRMSTPFSTPTLVTQVLQHADWVRRGYVWGYDGSVHYCFLDPSRRAWDIWEKRLHWDSLGWIAPNFVAAFAAVVAQQYWLAAILFAAIPTFPRAFLRHYRNTAREQNAAVVTNGPQMQYPFGLSTAGITAMGLTLTGIGVGLGAYLTSGALGSYAGVAIFGVSMSGPFLMIVAGLLTGVNLGAFSLFILGLLTKPFGWVLSPRFNVRDLAYGGWAHFGRNGQPFNTYRIGPNQPRGLRWGCGGLIPVIRNGAPSGNEGIRGVVHNAHDLIVWGLIPRDPGSGADLRGDDYWNRYDWDELSDADRRHWQRLGWDRERWNANNPPASGEKSWEQLTDEERRAARALGYDRALWDGEEAPEPEDPDRRWNGKSWDDLTAEERARWERLGWTRELWEGDGSPPSESTPWSELTEEQRDAASQLGYDRWSWDGADETGLIVVIGTEPFTNAHIGSLLTHGVRDAVATDGRLSPLMGTHGTLVMETNFALDPIQKYGFMCTPE